MVLLGPSTIVTADDNPALTGLNYNSVSVGQHIIARGIYELPASGVTTLDATGNSSTNTGSVRLISTQMYGPLVSSASGSLTMNLQTIDNWPVSNYNFTGNGTVTPASYVVNTGTLTLPTGDAAGSPLWIDGVTAPFGGAPPDFEAFAINPELSVPARLQVDWTSAGTVAPFATLTPTRVDDQPRQPEFERRSDPDRIREHRPEFSGRDTANRAQAPPAPPAGLPAVFQPVFAIGNLSGADATTITVTNNFATFVTQLPTAIVAATPAHHFVAAGRLQPG